jgi:hypothetical protein
MTSLQTTALSLADARKTCDEFTGRLPGALAALAAAKDHRHSLVAQTTRGVEVAPKTLRDAGLNFAAAEQSLEILREQIAETEAAVARAQAEHNAADKAEKDHAVALAQRAVIASGDNLTRLGKGISDGAVLHTKNFHSLFAAMREAGRAPSEAELASFQSLQARIPTAIPAPIQQQIVQRGSVVASDIGAVERSIWLRGAAPDAEGDAPYEAAAELAGSRVAQQQAFDAEGQKQAARSVGSLPAFLPTGMITAAGPRIRAV